MMLAGRTGFRVLIALAGIVAIGWAARAQETQYPKPTDLPNPYRLVEGWPNEQERRPVKRIGITCAESCTERL